MSTFTDKFYTLAETTLDGTHHARLSVYLGLISFLGKPERNKSTLNSKLVYVGQCWSTWLSVDFLTLYLTIQEKKDEFFMLLESFLSLKSPLFRVSLPLVLRVFFDSCFLML